MRRFATREDLARRQKRCAKLERVFARPIPFEWVVRYAPDGHISRSLYHGCEDPEILVNMTTRYATERELFRAVAALYRDAARELKVPEVGRWLRWSEIQTTPSSAMQARFDEAMKDSTQTRGNLLRWSWIVALAAYRGQLRTKASELVYELLNLMTLHRVHPYTHNGFYRGSGALRYRYMRIWRKVFPAPTIQQITGER